jgi:hypothetical protein
MERCAMCGRVETPLRDGICPACLTPPKHLGSESSPRPFACAKPSALLAAGLITQAVGGLFLGNVKSSSGSPVVVVLAYSSLVLLAVGGLLIAIGTIRWAIWPLIEAAHRDRPVR